MQSYKPVAVLEDGIFFVCGGRKFLENLGKDDNQQPTQPFCAW